MKACPACFGDGGHDFSQMDAPMARLCRVFGSDWVPVGVVECEVCEGAGTVSDKLYADYEAWAVARVDQFLAAEAAGEFA